MHHSPLQRTQFLGGLSVERSVISLQNAGLDMSKALIGIASYGTMIVIYAQLL